jgi:hypothetical protein
VLFCLLVCTMAPKGSKVQKLMEDTICELCQGDPCGTGSLI